MSESEFLKAKLDFYKSGFTIVAVSFAGLISFLAVNFGKNAFTLNFLAISAMIVLGIIFFLIIFEVSRIFKRMKELIK
jgi:cytochrome c biogenesis protein CcdA